MDLVATAGEELCLILAAVSLVHQIASSQIAACLAIHSPDNLLVLVQSNNEGLVTGGFPTVARVLSGIELGSPTLTSI